MVRWMLKIILLIIGIMLLTLAVASAQDDGTVYGLITGEHVEVRVGPDFAYDSVGELVRDASVVVVGRGGDFIQIVDGDRTLWVYSRYIRLGSYNIPVTSYALPRNRDGRVPEEFDLSSDVCTQWQGGYGQTGNFAAGDTSITLSYPGLQGATVYGLVVTSPTGFTTSFDSYTTDALIELDRLPAEGGTYTWRVAPYWTNGTRRYNWQSVCPMRTGGTFEKPVN